MADKLAFSLVSPERELFSGEVDQVVVPGADGDFGVLAQHAPLMSTIRPGAITVFDAGAVRRIFVHGGFADVTPEGLTILAEEAIAVEDIDLEALQKSLHDAREDIADAKTEESRERAAAALARLEAMEQAATHAPYGG